ncbi:uncharacterized protein DUF1116 [Paraburkholderia rhizosphaerae]|uniref:Uncharacterized protein DUF1116 n=2 Tax=Paraburkholderia rhizosphaerae TaxID=480658 RepID=A0A4R8LH29_9BURK|nr:DUF1116 domain-containing protein [Paraburkholderia rhizosphaerae]TDY42476.1 uncharacterized protein DUF1116 [Paraburkholderia rhizosphaerae]
MTPGNAPASNDANRDALARLYAVRPHWQAVSSARDALGLPEFTLLHAGPPYANPCDPAAPVRSSAVLCCLYEKWASTEAQAEQLIASGQVKLVNAQSFGVVTPLAAVVSPSSTLVEVGDPRDPSHRAWSLAGSGAGPQIRFGSRNPAVLERLAWRDTVLARELVAVLGRTGPIDLLALAATGLANGDDLHARTSAATAALRAQLSPFIEARPVDAMLADTPLFFLTLWMAACHLMMSATARDADPATTLVVALAGNGREAGVRLAGRPSVWTTCAAGAPAGPRLDHATHAAVAPLTGDSGIIDAAGFGAQAFALAPEPASTFAAWLPADWHSAQPALLAGAHPAFGRLHSALDAAAVVRQNVEPLAAIAMIGADGRAGLVGRGVYAAPVALFEAALRAL